ncbi:MAG: PIG-L deacetylase family protein [Pyrinomonadaceae bacterium]
MKNNDAFRDSALAAPEKLPLLAAETVKNWGKTLIVAPHPDDESLGCGGAIALLRSYDCVVEVLVMSDGTLSHPNSKKFPALVLRDLRENEIISALEILGGAAMNISFLRYPDRSVPNKDSDEFPQAVEICQKFLEKTKPKTILLPWRRDPHPDHFAANQIISAAKTHLSFAPKIIEYPIWLWELATGADAPQSSEVKAWRLNIETVLAKKQTAIAAHRSQTTDLIDDDPTAFRLTPEILMDFAAPWEIYLETVDE